MNRIDLIKISDEALIVKERRKYLDSLPVFQELFLELLVQEGTCYFIEMNNKKIGYVVIHSNSTHIVEYYTGSNDILLNQEILLKIIRLLNISMVYCKTFDYKLMTAINLITQKFTIAGIMFRDYIEKEPLIEKQFKESIAEEADLARIQGIDDTFFESEEEISFYIKNKNIILFDNEDNQLMGCGLYQNVAYDYGYSDIGMLVNPAFRQRRYGTHIIKRLVNICKEEGKKPICGCAYDNKASLKTLIKAGFIPGHVILKYKIL